MCLRVNHVSLLALLLFVVVISAVHIAYRFYIIIRTVTTIIIPVIIIIIRTKDKRNMSVTPPQLQYSAISYSVKCVSVESERVLADVLALERSKHQPSVKRPDRQHDVKSTKFKHNRKANLTALTLNSPDFLELNKKRPPSLARRHTLEEQCKFYHRLHDRSNSLGDAGFPLNEDDYCESSDEISDEIVKSKKVNYYY